MLLLSVLTILLFGLSFLSGMLGLGVALVAVPVLALFGFDLKDELAVKGPAEAIVATGYPTLSKLMGDYREVGGRLLACPPGIAKRGIDRDTLVDNAEGVAAGRFILEMSSASHVLVY